VKELRGKEISIESARDPTSAIYSNISQVNDEIPGEVKQEAINSFVGCHAHRRRQTLQRLTWLTV